MTTEHRRGAENKPVIARMLSSRCLWCVGKANKREIVMELAP